VSSCAPCHYLKEEPACLFIYLKCPFVYPTCLIKETMLSEPNELENYVEEFLKKLMVDRPISEGIQASSNRGLQYSPSTGHHFGHVNPVIKQQSNHYGDLANEKKIPSTLPKYIPPLVGVVNHDSIHRDFEYSIFTTYIPK
jgi:hypothetical protein